MSGGVDSSVAAALLKEQGYDCIGITMSLYCSTKASAQSCCSMESAADAKKVADQLGIPHYVLNFRDQFKKEVIDNFIEEYKRGRTPNPCIRCNQFIKFEYLRQKAKELGAELIATGHYARIKSEILNSKSEINSKFQFPNYKLLKGKDKKKDQSYVLYMMNQESLAHTLFPLGEMTKEEVRKKAKKIGLPVHDKEESQEICFVEDDDYGRFLREKCPDAVKPGKILDKNGKVVGQHDGIAFYTLGQRKGIGAHKAMPKYVVKIDPKTNTIIIGDQGDLLGKELIADQISYVSGRVPTKPLNITAKIRYNSSEAPAILYPDGKVTFTEPQRAITPGQSVVFYRGEEVLGGGIIN